MPTIVITIPNQSDGIVAKKLTQTHTNSDKIKLWVNYSRCGDLLYRFYSCLF